MQQPHTPEQWQEAVDAADYLLILESAIQYGLLTLIADPDAINVERCRTLLLCGAQRGVYPTDPASRRRAIARWLHHERTALQMTQLELGRACGISQQWVQRIEAGTHPIRDDTLARLRASIDALKEPPLKERHVGS
jgi:DNA-binding XRE family transcriptional regulator